MHCWDLEMLLREYAQGNTREEVYIRNTLEEILHMLKTCDREEYYYAEKIARDFCQVIRILKRQQEKEISAVRTQNANAAYYVRYDDALILLEDFYNYYKDEGQVEYWEIRGALAEGKKELVNATMKDYVARIQTFAGRRYLGEMFTPEEMGNKDPVLFLYENIEMILAKFNTKDENGQPVKQKVNLRSALRKLNQFKRDRELR